MGYLSCSYTHFIDCLIHLERNKVLTIRYFCCWNRWPLTIQHEMFAKLQWVTLAFLGQVNNHLSALRFIVVPSQQKCTHWYVHGRHHLARGGFVYSEQPVKAASVSWILGVCSQYNPETQRENTGNISTCVQLWLSPVTLLQNFFSFSTGRTQNGKLSKLVSEADKHWLRNCAKIARLVNASSLVPS